MIKAIWAKKGAWFMNPRSKQRGATLLEMMLVIGIVIYATVLAFESKHADFEQMEARAAGGKLFEYNNAVRSWMAKNPNASNSTHSGSSWLKSTDCGGVNAVGFISCNFPDSTPASPIDFGKLELKTVIEIQGAGAERRIVATTTTSPYLNAKRQPRSDLSGIAAIIAAAGSTQSSTPILMSTDGQYKSNPSTAAITMTASNNASNDIWLRTDGSNTMNNNLKFNSTLSADRREITNVSRIQNIALSTLYLGNANGSLVGSSVIVDADQGLLGAMTISNVRNQADALTLSKGNLRLNSGGISATGNIQTSAAVLASGNVQSSSKILADGNIESQSNVVARAFVDRDNSTFFLDPSETSVFRKLNVKERSEFDEYILIKGIATAGGSCTENGLIARDSSGSSLSCVNKIWKNFAPEGDISYSNFTMGYSGTRDLGQQTFCAIGTYRSDSEDDGLCQVYRNGNNWFITTSQQSYVGCAAVCVKF